MSPHAFVICSLNARWAGETRATLPDLFKSHGLPARFHFGDDREKATAFLRENVGLADRIVVGGGDGTIRGLLPEILALGKPHGILPLDRNNAPDSRTLSVAWMRPRSFFRPRDFRKPLCRSASRS